MKPMLVRVLSHYGDSMEKKKILKPEKTKDKSIEVVYSYKEVQNSAQNALEKYLSNMNKKV